MGGIRLLVLDGSDTIGGSKLLLNYDSSNVLLDFGTSFKAIGTYYEEFLQPRSTAGLLDYVVMGVLPDARNLYRDDLMHPDLTLTGPDVGRIDAMLLSHAHADHFGDMGFLRLDVPVVTSPMSAAIVKAMADSSGADIGKDFISPTPRKGDASSGQFLLRACSAKDMSTLNIRGRDFVMCGGSVPGALSEFWGFSPAIKMKKENGRPKPHLPGPLERNLDTVGFKSYPVDHSVKGATGYVLSTSQGNIVYTGDLRRHGINGSLTDDFVQAAKSPRPHAMIIEGTRVGRSSDSEAEPERATEQDVLRNVQALMPGISGKFAVADFGPRNIERLEIFLKVSKENHRRMVVTTKDAYLLHAMHMVDPAVPVPGDDMLIYDCPKGSEDKYEEYMLSVVYPEETVVPKAVAQSPGDYLMAFSFFDLKHLVDLRPRGGHYLYSSCEAFTEEQEVDFVRMGAWLDKFHLKAHGFAFDKDGKPEFDKGPSSLHASGHATEEDIVKIVEAIDPEAVIPVHTARPDWFSEAFGGQRKVVIPSKGAWTDI